MPRWSVAAARSVAGWRDGRTVPPDWYDAGMSHDGATLFRRFHDAWSRGDLDAVRALVDPEIVARPLHGLLFTRMEFRGVDGIADWYSEMTDPWDSFEAVVED